MNKSEVILELGAEGGSLTLFGTRSEHSWVYRTYTIDQTPTLVDEQESRHWSDWVDSWEGALALLDKYPWTKLVPLAVHAEFRQQVWGAVQTRFEPAPSKTVLGETANWEFERWRECCGRDPHNAQISDSTESR
ncbi:MAG TPA: hypothetical protein VEK84_08480 [Terriglobales bacterium]|nr:hypothetical protein [Terriglobales bacterium]